MFLPQVVIDQEEFGSGNVYPNCSVMYLYQIISLSLYHSCPRQGMLITLPVVGVHLESFGSFLLQK